MLEQIFKFKKTNKKPFIRSHFCIDVLNTIFSSAIKKNATDVHFEPYAKGINVKMRVQGKMENFKMYSETFKFSLIARMKALAQLDVTEHRYSQDGRIDYLHNSERISFRICTVPSQFGEGAVLRLLNRDTKNLSLEKLGMPNNLLNLSRTWMQARQGMIILAGPTGVGKTTTLYAILKELNEKNKKIITIEDPVEFTLEGVVQCEVREKEGFSFSRAIRSFLRQDPDILVVGELRDYETAFVACKAALTGHLVITTLHAPNAPYALLRLIDLGISPYLLAPALKGIIAQKLFYKNNKTYPCFEGFEVSESIRQLLIEENFEGKQICHQAYKDGWRKIPNQDL